MEISGSSLPILLKKENFMKCLFFWSQPRNTSLKGKPSHRTIHATPPTHTHTHTPRTCTYTFYLDITEGLFTSVPFTQSIMTSFPQKVTGPTKRKTFLKPQLEEMAPSELDSDITGMLELSDQEVKTIC